MWINFDFGCPHYSLVTTSSVFGSAVGRTVLASKDKLPSFGLYAYATFYLVCWFFWWTKCFNEHLVLHSFFFSSHLYACLNDKYFSRFQYTLTSKFDDSFHLEILKEALLRAIHDIDAKFSEVILTFWSVLQSSI